MADSECRRVGIACNRKLIDDYYKYCKLRESLNKCELSTQEREDNERNCCLAYLSVISKCLEKIKRETNADIRRDYLDWIRWNRRDIHYELNRFAQIAHIAANDDNLGEKICALKSGIDKVYHNWFVLNESERSISAEFIHAFRLSKRTTKPLLHKQAANLYVSYANILRNKCYIDKPDIEDITFEQFDEMADYLLKMTNDAKLKWDIKLAKNGYRNFRKTDGAARLAQETDIANAVRLAHRRVAENRLISIRSLIRENSFIEDRLCLYKLLI